MQCNSWARARVPVGEADDEQGARGRKRAVTLERQPRDAPAAHSQMLMCSRCVFQSLARILTFVLNASCCTQCDCTPSSLPAASLVSNFCKERSW